MATAELLRHDTSPTFSAPKPPFDVEGTRRDFPILARRVHGNKLAYLDNAATTQKPQSVIDAIYDYYSDGNANVHRGVHLLSQEATDAYERARRTAQHFLRARDESEVVFTSGATEAINLVAQTYGRKHLQAGDEVIVSEMEHHANIVPWQMICQERQAKLRVIPIDDDGDLMLDQLECLLSPRTKVVAVTHLSNVLGTVNAIGDIVRMAHQVGAVVLVDGAQAASHLPIDVGQLDCDFYVMSAHKLYGPTGIGVLYGKAELLNAMPPYRTGGDMIRTVSFEETTFNDIPNKFEAGTPNIAGAVGLSAAIDYLNEINSRLLHDYESNLLRYTRNELNAIPGIRLVGSPLNQSAVISFTLDGVHPHDIGTILDRQGVAIRTGHHCAQPLMDRLGLPATSRISIGMYNTTDDIDAAVAAIRNVKELFRC